MPVGTVMLIRVPAAVGDESVDQIRQRLITEVNQRYQRRPQCLTPDDFYDERPLQLVEFDDEIPTASRNKPGRWFNLKIALPYYGKGYERGELPVYAVCAEWLEANIQDCEIWYGHDIDFENLQPFGPQERRSQVEYYDTVGNRPYDDRHRDAADQLMAMFMAYRGPAE